MVRGLQIARPQLIHAFIQLGPLPDMIASTIRKLPIPGLQKIAAADSIISNYVGNLYNQADEKSLDGCSSMLVRSVALQLYSINSPLLQESYKAYRELHTGQPAPLPLIVSDLGMNIVAGTSGWGRSVDLFLTSIRHGECRNSVALHSVQPGAVRGHLGHHSQRSQRCGITGG